MSGGSYENRVADATSRQLEVSRAAIGHFAWRALRAACVPLALALLSVTVSPSSAGAQILHCESQHLSADDRGAARRAAQALLPHGDRAVISFPCRTPTWAHVWITTPTIRTAQGVDQWREFTCTRKVGPWHCDAPEFKQRFSVSLTVREDAHRVEINFDEATSFERARALAGRALTIYAEPETPVAACENGAPRAQEESRGSFWAKPIVVDVTHDGLQDQVHLEGTDVVLEFSGTTADRDTLELVCWGTMIVVT